MSRRIVTGIAAGSALVISLTGCMGDAGTGKGAAPGGSAKQLGLSALQVLEKTSDKTSRIESFVSDTRFTGSYTIGSRTSTMTMHVGAQMRTKPDLAFRMAMDDVKVDGKAESFGIEMIVVDDALYMKGFAAGVDTKSRFGKEWAKAPLSAVGGVNGKTMKQLLSQAQQANPTESTKMFTGSKDAHEVGQETVDGVRTTKYAGTVSIAEALGKLDSTARADAEKQLKGMDRIGFQLWVDDQQRPRKMDMTLNGPFKFTTSTTFKDYGRSLDIAAPPASEVRQMDANELRKLGNNDSRRGTGPI